MEKQLLLGISTALRPSYLSAVQGPPTPGKLCRFPHAFYQQLRSVVSSTRSSSRAVLTTTSIPFTVGKQVWLRPIHSTGQEQHRTLHRCGRAELATCYSSPYIVTAWQGGCERLLTSMRQFSSYTNGSLFFLKSQVFF